MEGEVVEDRDHRGSEDDGGHDHGDGAERQHLGLAPSRRQCRHTEHDGDHPDVGGHVDVEETIGEPPAPRHGETVETLEHDADEVVQW